ncbi:MAG: glutathione S-transferase [Pseudomonadota bacterium]
MKLYSAPGTCGTAMHIVLNWIGKPFEVEHLDFKGMKSTGYLKLNPAGVVPTLVDEDGPLSEGLAILLKLVDDNPDADIGPAVGEPERDQLYRWLAFLSATLHPFYWPYFMPQRYHADADQHGAVRAAAEERVASALDVIEAHLEDKTWMLGNQRTVVDAFLYPMANWAYGFGKPTSAYPNIDRVVHQLAADPAVLAVHAAQGTAPKVNIAA